jgi:GNAT superfamily N-acetyltransferase
MDLPIRLVRGIDLQVVDARLADLAERHIVDYETLWVEELQESQQEDKYWDWVYKRSQSDVKGNYEGYAVEYESRTQGLMLIETQQHRSLLAPGERIVYIVALASAPWNRVRIHPLPTLKGVGLGLLLFARQRSVEIGYGGRMGLHALPRSERFYERQNMTRCEVDPEQYLVDPEDNLAYFEYSLLRR